MAGYRLLELSAQYDGYLSQFYKKNPEYTRWGYEELKKNLFEDGFSEAGHIHKYLKNMGVESDVVFFNNRNLQDKSNFRRKGQTYYELLIKQIKAFKPDVIFNTWIEGFSKEETKEIKECCGKNIKLVGYSFVAPISDLLFQNAPLYDQIYTGSKDYVEYYREKGLNAFLLRHAFEPEILERMAGIEPDDNVCFCGSINISQHANRLDMLEKLLDNDIAVCCYASINGLNELIYNSDLDIKTRRRYFDVVSRMIGRIEPSVFGIDYYKMLRSHWISINAHSNLAADGAGNVRMYESTGVGVCLLTDKRPGNGDIFEEDREIVTYSSYDEMVEKIIWLLKNPEIMKTIALAGQQRTLRQYTYKNKAEQLNEWIQLLF